MNPLLRPCSAISSLSESRCSHSFPALRLGTISLMTCVLAACGGSEPAPEVASPSDQVEGRASTMSASKRTDPPMATTTMSLNEIVVRASSTVLQGTGALIQLRYQDQVIADGEISSTGLSDLRFRVAGNFGGGTLDLVFTNAGTPNTAMNRRLTVEGVYINGTRFAPNAAGVTYDLGHGAAAFDGLYVKPGTSVITETGALRIGLPASNLIGPPAVVPSDMQTSPPGPYVSQWSGADTNPGTKARPYRTLAALVGRALLPGENIHLQCGNLWRETLALGVSELPDGVEIRRYGDDCAAAGNPVIVGSDVFNGGWARSGAVWSRALPAGTPQITRLFVGYTSMRQAQWPNAGEPQALVAAAVPGQPTRFTVDDAAAAALAGRNIAGATVLVRTMPWKIESHRVTAQGLQGAVVPLVSAPVYGAKTGDAYLLRDQAWMLDAPGEFFHDTAAQRLYLIPSAADAALDLNSVQVEGSVRDTAIEIQGRNGIVLRDLAVRLARQDGIRMTNAPAARLLGVESRENGHSGIRLMQWNPVPGTTPGPVIENSLVAGNGVYGIDTTYAAKARISGNRVLDTGVGVYVGDAIAGIAGGPGARIEDNRVDGAAYAGVMFSSLQGSVVNRNEISRYCLRLSDCGGIYTWAGSPAAGTGPVAVVSDNRIQAAVAAVAGSLADGADVVAGVYLDDFTQRVEVRDNFFQGMPIGVFLHNASGVLVERNRVWLATTSALSVSMDRFDGDWSVGNVLRQNDIVPMTTASATWPTLPTFSIAHPIRFHHVLQGPAALGAGRNEFYGNTVTQLNGVIPEHARVSGAQGIEPYSVAQWRQANPGEPDVARPMVFSPYDLALGPEKLPAGQFDGGIGAWVKHWNWQVGGYDVQPVWSQPGCTGHCVRMTVGETGDALMSPDLTLRGGVPHLYSWTAISGGTAASVGQSYIARSVSPWDGVESSRGFVGLSKRAVGAGQTQRYEALFTPRANITAKVILQLETPGVPVFLDAVSVREVLGWSFAAPMSWSAVIVAPKDTPRSVNGCAELGWGADCQITNAAGQPLAFPVQVPARGQQLLLWANSPFRR